MNQTDTGKCIILSAGDFVPVDLNRQEGDLLIACDAGLHYANRMGILPDLIVGDFDSLSSRRDDMEMLYEIMDSDPERVVRLDTHKDDTDTLRAVRIGLDRGYRTFYLYGALGGSRLDHTLANLQTLLFIKHHGGVGYIMDSDQIIMVAENETIRFHRGMTGILSIFAMNSCAEDVTMKGLEYETDHVTISNDFPIGVSNEFIIDEEATITVGNGTLLIIARWAQVV